MSRKTIRNILIGIIVLTIPCYICGIAILAMPSERDTPITQPTRTPINPFGSVSPSPIDVNKTATTAVTATLPLFATSTLGFEPIVTIQPFFTFTPIFTNTPLATVTPLPSATPFPTNTPTFTPTTEILLPATDTPNP